MTRKRTSRASRSSVRHGSFAASVELLRDGAKSTTPMQPSVLASLRNMDIKFSQLSALLHRKFSHKTPTSLVTVKEDVIHSSLNGLEYVTHHNSDYRWDGRSNLALSRQTDHKSLVFRVKPLGGMTRKIQLEKKPWDNAQLIQCVAGAPVIMNGNKCYTGGFVATYVISLSSEGTLTPVLKSVDMVSAQHLDILYDTAQQFCECLKSHVLSE